MMVSFEPQTFYIEIFIVNAMYKIQTHLFIACGVRTRHKEKC